MVNKKNEKLFETDLSKPLKEYFEKEGYLVRCEVKDCDMTATKDEKFIVIELKKRLSIDLVIQAVERQKISDYVYIAVPKPKKSVQNLRKLITMIKRLELGLIFVSFDKSKAEKSKTKVDFLVHPDEYEFYRNERKRKEALKEISMRNSDYNEAGSSKKKIITAYREQALFIACVLNKYGEMSPKDIKKYVSNEKAGNILYKNFYGWYIHERKGIYSISNGGKKAIETYSEVVEHYQKLIDKV